MLQMCFLHSFSSRVQATVFFHLEGCPVHLEPAAQGVEIQPQYLPDYNTSVFGLIQTALENGGAPEHLRYIDDINL